MSDVVLRIDNLSKRYRKGIPSGNDRLTELLANMAKAVWRGSWSRLRRPVAVSGQRVEEADKDDGFWALRDISFEVRQGQGVAIVGRNGAGKSTLLKVVSRVTQPTSGRFCLQGRVASLLEAGAGFHGELTGRENIFLGGALLGVSRRAIARRFDEVVDYAGVGSFLDTPVKRYSSGMYTRLAFSVAIFMDLDILIVDEILSVGDAEFQQRALASLREQLRQGKTLLYVSHDPRQLGVLCDRYVKLDKGRVVAEGPIADLRVGVVNERESSLSSLGEKRSEAPGSAGTANGEKWSRSNADGALAVTGLTLGLSGLFDRQLEGDLILRTRIATERGDSVAQAEIRLERHSSSGLARGERHVSVRCWGFPPGRYTATFSCVSPDGAAVAPSQESQFSIATQARGAVRVHDHQGVELAVVDRPRLTGMDG
jgi:ABC-type polysaccharide/polyol phosphate transport system ATPase subunit